MSHRFFGLFQFLGIVLLATFIFNYSYSQIQQASADIVVTANPPVSAAAAVPAVNSTSPAPAQNSAADTLYMPPYAIPILMYHEIGDGPNSLFVSEQNFAEQMRCLYDHGYQAVSMAQASRILAEGKPVDKLVILTFDDGYLTFYTKVWPVLKQYNYSATVFVITGFVGYYSNYANWEQLKELNANGMEIGCHTMTHPSLTTLNTAGLQQQINGSRAVLQQNGIIADAFCYPSGQYNQNTINQVKNAGFKSAVTTQYGISAANQNAYLLSRIRISRYTSLKNFQAALAIK